jgi:hypothetical protein
VVYWQTKWRFLRGAARSMVRPCIERNDGSTFSKTWKISARIFQALENIPRNLPMPGKTPVYFSNVWKR